jgi:two-component system sensor histidine kinase TctE
MSEDAAQRESYVRTTFLERLAHELRGPSGVALGALDEIEHALGEDAARIRPLLEMARRGSRRVLHTADRLSQTAQLEGAQVRLHFTLADARVVVRSGLARAVALEGRRTVQLVDGCPDEPVRARIDETWLEAAIFELGCEALTRARSRVEVTLDQRGSTLCLRLLIDAESLPHEPVCRFSAQAERRDSGLAFALVRDVAESHGGALRLAKPAPGTSTFCLELPTA